MARSAKTGRFVTKMTSAKKLSRTNTPPTTLSQRSATMHKVSGSVKARSAVTGRFVKANSKKSTKKASE